MPRLLGGEIETYAVLLLDAEGKRVRHSAAPKDLALAHGLRACWSVPVFSSQTACSAPSRCTTTSRGPPGPQSWRRSSEETIAHRGVLEPGIHFIEKPFSLDSLARKLREALGS